MTDLVSQAINTIYGGSPEALAAIMVMASMTEVGVPFPFVFDTILFTLGYSFTRLWPQLALVVLALMMGRLVGSSVLYFIARFLGRRLSPFFTRNNLFSRGKVAILTGKLGAQFSVAIARLGAQVPTFLGFTSLGLTVPVNVAVARVTPGLLSVSSLASGVVGLSYPSFALGVAISSAFADFCIITLGALMGSVLSFLGYSFSPWFIFAGLALLMMSGLIVTRITGKKDNLKAKMEKGNI